MSVADFEQEREEMIAAIRVIAEHLAEDIEKSAASQLSTNSHKRQSNGLNENGIPTLLSVSGTDITGGPNTRHSTR